MGERYTKKDVYMAFTRLASSLGKVWSDDHGKLWKGDYWEPIEEGQLWVSEGNANRARVGAWTLDHNSIYGGYVIEEIYNVGGGITQPFGSTRHNAREFCDMVRFALNAQGVK